MKPEAIKTRFSALIGTDYPIIAAPMFLVSNVGIVATSSNAGAVGGAPSLNWRSAAEFDAALHDIESKTDKPYAINLIVNKSNPRLAEDLAVIAAHKVPMVITSLGNPQSVIDVVHGYGGKVFCDVTTLAYAEKVAAQGADGVIAVSAGAGGHAGGLSPMVLLPYLREKLDIPVIAAGGIVTGRQILAALVLGADGVQIGTRFIASDEAQVAQGYKDAIVNAAPEDIVLTSRISGTPAAVIRTPYIDKIGLELPWYEKMMRNYPATSRAFKTLRYALGTRQLTASAEKPSWKTVWSAGQGAGLVHDIKPCRDIIEDMAREYWDAHRALKG